MVSIEKNNFKRILEELEPNQTSIESVARYLDYDVGTDPINPESGWKVYFSKRIKERTNGVIAVKPTEGLDQNTSIPAVRKLSQSAIELSESFGTGFRVEVIAFLGHKRIVFFKNGEANRDIRLDINPDTVDRKLYINNLNLLKDENIKITEDIFGFGNYEIKVSDEVFKKELTSHFLTTVSFYRKKLSELITGNSKIREELSPVLSYKAQVYLKQGQSGLVNLVDDESYKSVMPIVVDTILLRQLMRRFLEAYYGYRTFEVSGISLGVGNGTLDDAINEQVTVAKNLGEEKKIAALNRKKIVIGQSISLFDSDEAKETSEVKLNDTKRGPSRIKELTERAQKQFELVYAGDLYAGSISNVANNIEKAIALNMSEFWAKFWEDTASGNYSFRYEDMPPESLEKQYEVSMGQNVQIKIETDKDGNKKPVIFYGDDFLEQKEKGAYYTDKRFVDYMIKQTVEPEFRRRFDKIKEIIATDSSVDEVKKAIDYLIDMKIADFTSGGGSFLRGAFIALADKYESLQTLKLSDEVRASYPFFNNNDESQYQWEKYILEHMIYGVDVDYKALIISSLTLTLSSLQHHPQDVKLPQLIGKTLIHQNSLINSVPYYKRKSIYSRYKQKIAKLIQLKKGDDFQAYDNLRRELQAKMLPKIGNDALAKEAPFLHIEAIELNLPEVYFNEDGTLKKDGGMDIVVGNPPWEKWKPSDDEFFAPFSDKFGKKKAGKQAKNSIKKEVLKDVEVQNKYEKYKKRYSLGSEYFTNEDNYKYGSWTVNGRKTSGDINLYIVSVERFTQLGKPDFSSAILVPDNVVTDLGTTGLRHLLFDNYEVNEFLSFDNNKGIFTSVHRSYKFAVLSFDGKKKSTEEFRAFFYRKDLADLDNEELKIKYSMSLIEKFEPERYALFEATSQQDFDTYVKIRSKFKSLAQTQLIDFGRDFDKTNDSKLFKPLDSDEKNLLPLYEGKYMNQFAIFPDKITQGVSEEDVQAKVDENYMDYRIALRTIGRATDVRTLIASLLPPYSTAANSLNVQKYANLMSLPSKLFLLGMLNSYTIDYVLRKLVSSNINKIYLNQLPLPQFSDVEDAEDIALISKELLKENKGYYTDLDVRVPGDKYAGLSHDMLIAKLNARVMHDFDIDRQELLNIMKSFESAAHVKDVEKMTQLIINEYEKLEQ
ncbi:Eco57I restriction-modification methylase domain-containing protein [Limosilactobacillus mucosae]|uniref:Eco57I restriction-modification methylase domain-containing protein n=1 Tax=Limosilactobacillus mucosae TaxID=97478 RepID=UPI003991C8B9